MPLAATPSSLVSLKSRMVKPVNFVKCRLGQVVLETRPINGYLSPLLPRDGFLMMSADVLIQYISVWQTDRRTDRRRAVPRYAYACCVRRAVKLQQKRGVCLTWYGCTFGCTLSLSSSCYNVGCTDKRRRTERRALLAIADVSPALYANDYELGNGKWYWVLFHTVWLQLPAPGIVCPCV